MIYVFCDEDINFDNTNCTLVFSAVAFSQYRFNSGFSKILKLREGGGSLLSKIKQALIDMGGFAIISHSKISNRLVPSGENFRTNDIPRMSRKDAAWSISMILTVAHLIYETINRIWVFKTADIFYDPKSLTRDHLSSVEQTLHSRLKVHANRLVQKSNKNLGEKINIRRIKAVEKVHSGAIPDKFQLGVCLADRIVRRYDEVESHGCEGLIEIEYITKMVEDTINDFMKIQNDSSLDFANGVNAS